MPYPDIRAGMRLTAGRLRGMQWQRVMQGETQTVNNSTTLVDTNLIIPAEAGAEYLYQVYVSYNTDDATSGAKFAWSFPSNGTVARFSTALGINGTGTLNSFSDVALRRPGASGEVPAGTHTGGNMGYWEQGFVRGGNGGNITLQFAQEVATAANTSITASSFLIYLRDE